MRSAVFALCCTAALVTGSDEQVAPVWHGTTPADLHRFLSTRCQPLRRAPGPATHPARASTPGRGRRVRVPDESVRVDVRSTRPTLTSCVRAQRISQYIQARQQKRRVAPVELISAGPRAYNDDRETRATFPRLLRGERLAGQPARLLPLPSDAGQRGGNEEHGLHGVLLLALRLRHAGRTRSPL